MKRILSLILAFVFVMGICASAPITITASAVELKDESGFKFELNEDSNSYALVSIEGVEIIDSKVSVPEKYNGLPWLLF